MDHDKSDWTFDPSTIDHDFSGEQPFDPLDISGIGNFIGPEVISDDAPAEITIDPSLLSNLWQASDWTGFSSAQGFPGLSGNSGTFALTGNSSDLFNTTMPFDITYDVIGYQNAEAVGSSSSLVLPAPSEPSDCPNLGEVYHANEYRLPLHIHSQRVLTETPNTDAPEDVETRRKAFDGDTTSTLNTWLRNHLDHPYPSRDEKHELAESTGLTLRQVDDWYCNKRKRCPVFSSQPSPSASTSRGSGYRYGDRGRTPDSTTSSWREQSCESVQTAFSAISEGLEYDRPKRGKKRRCYQDKPPVARSKRTRNLESGFSNVNRPMFECTFCGMALSSKAWKRHEETKHLPQAVWICMATGPLLETVDTATGQRREVCAFCGDHVDGFCPKPHRVQECLSRTSDQRTFDRKQYLRRHLRQYHHAELNDVVADRWKSPLSYASIVWHCGFCGAPLDDWTARAKHISRHFLDGFTMESWSDDLAKNSSSNLQETQTDFLEETQTDFHVRELVQSGDAFLCPPEDGEISPHTHCFDNKHYIAGNNSRYFPGCESIRLGLSEPIDDLFIQTHTWTCSNGIDLILSAKGKQVAMYWFRVPVETINDARPSMDFNEQFLLSLRLDRPPTAFVQRTNESPILSRDLSWPLEQRNFSILLKFSDLDSLGRLTSFLSTTISDKCQLPTNLNTVVRSLAQSAGDVSNPATPPLYQVICKAPIVHDLECPVIDQSQVKNEESDFVRILDFEAAIQASQEQPPSNNSQNWITQLPDYPTHPSHAGGASNTVFEFYVKHYKCGYPLYRTKRWGCSRTFRGLIGIADHLRSRRGKDCKRHLLRLRPPSAAAPLDQHGLPKALFEIHPALRDIPDDSLANLSDPDGDGEDEVGMGGRPLSTILSVSSRSRSSRSRSVIHNDHTMGDSQRSRHGRPLILI